MRKHVPIFILKFKLPVVLCHMLLAELFTLWGLLERRAQPVCSTPQHDLRQKC